MSRRAFPPGRAARPPRSAGQRHPHGLCRRRDRPGVADANIVGNVTQLGFNGYVYDSLRLDGRLRNREFDGRITARDPNLDFDFFGTVDPERLRAALRLHDGPAARRSGPAAYQPPRFGVAALGRIVRCRRRAFARRPERPDSGDRRPLPLQRQGDRGLQHRPSRARTPSGASSWNCARTSPTSRSGRKPATAPSSNTCAGARGNTCRCSGGRKVGGDASERKAAVANDFSLLSVNIRNFNPVADAVAAGLADCRRFVVAVAFQPGERPVVAQGLVGVYRTAADACHAPLGQRFEPRGFARALRLGRGPLCGVLHLPQLSLTGGARQNRVQVTAGFDRYAAPGFGTRGVPGRRG